MSYGDFDSDEEEGLALFDLKVGENTVGTYGVGEKSGDIYVSGELHPLGAYSALLQAAKEHVPYVAVSAVHVLYPLDWLRAECMHDQDRLRVFNNLEREIRTHAKEMKT